MSDLEVTVNTNFTHMAAINELKMMVFTQHLIDSDENVTNKFEIEKLTNSLNDISMPLTYYQNQRVKNCNFTTQILILGVARIRLGST